MNGFFSILDRLLGHLKPALRGVSDAAAVAYAIGQGLFVGISLAVMMILTKSDGRAVLICFLLTFLLVVSAQMWIYIRYHRPRVDKHANNEHG
jgi:hypothetical protein